MKTLALYLRWEYAQRMRSATLQWVVICLGALVGCTRSTDVGPSTVRDAGERPTEDRDTRVTAGDGLCTRLAEINCAAEQRCCSTVTRSQQSCLNELTQSCAGSLYLDEIAAQSQSAFDPDAAERAFRELADRTSRCEPGILQWIPSDTGLRSIFRGSLGAGERCSPSGGLTAPVGSVAAALSACSHADGLACLPQSLLGMWSCTAKQPIGQACVTDDNCANNGACNNFGQAALGVCVERLPLGAACEFAGQCASLYCDSQVCKVPTADAVYCATS